MKILIQIIACIALGLILGVVFWLCDGGKPCQKVSECPVGVSNAQEMVFGRDREPVKIYQGQWVEDSKQIGCWWSVGALEVKK